MGRWSISKPLLSSWLRTRGQADPAVSSLQITAVVAAIAHRVAAKDPAVAGHPWRARANQFCLVAIKAMGDDPHALELAFTLQFLDAVHDTYP